MKDLKAMRKEFQELDKAIMRLRKAEKELSDLQPSEEIFRMQFTSIKSKLKQPKKVDEVERELADLKRRIASIEPGLPSSLAINYYDVAFIGGGAFARVYKAKRKEDNKEVAVKIPRSLDESTGRRFMNEIKTFYESFEHPNIVRLYKCNILPIPYLEMEYCEKSFDKLPTPLAVERAAYLVFQIAEGLKYAHARDRQHRDIKPQNIFLKDEVPKIGDWGLSKLSSENKSSADHIFALAYAAPEQLSSGRFGNPDHRTDIYQLGVVFYELTTGKVPFEGGTEIELMTRIMDTEPTRISLLKPGTSSVEHIIMKCLEKKIGDRYKNIGDMQKELADYLKIEYKDSLSRTRGDISRSCLYLSQLCFIHLTRGNWAEALIYLEDLKNYTKEQRKGELGSLISEIEFRQKEGLGNTEDLVGKAAIILHQIKMGR
jgi:serine/threonine protein kinase